MQIKEFEALTLKECLQQVRSEMGPDAVILETRKFRRGGVMGIGAHDAVAIVAAIGITVDADSRRERPGMRGRDEKHGASTAVTDRDEEQGGGVPAVTAPSRAGELGANGESLWGGALGANGDSRWDGASPANDALPQGGADGANDALRRGGAVGANGDMGPGSESGANGDLGRRGATGVDGTCPGSGLAGGEGISPRRDAVRATDDSGERAWPAGGDRAMRAAAQAMRAAEARSSVAGPARTAARVAARGVYGAAIRERSGEPISTTAGPAVGGPCAGGHAVSPGSSAPPVNRAGSWSGDGAASTSMEPALGRARAVAVGCTSGVVAAAERSGDCYAGVFRGGASGGESLAEAANRGTADAPTTSMPRSADDRALAADRVAIRSELSGAAAGPMEDAASAPGADRERGLSLAYLERAVGEIRLRLLELQRAQRDGRAPSSDAETAAESDPDASGAELDAERRFPELEWRMRDSGVSDGLAAELCEQLPDMDGWSAQAQAPLAVSAMRNLVSRRIVTCGAIRLEADRPKVVALIGPTGVGKTTTIAKLAAQYALIQGKRVALVTVDTYRIAAVEQLRTYSQIIGLPVSVAYSAAELPAVLREYADYDLILIDTAGRSPQHTAQIDELKALLAAVRCETHLVLSATMKERDMVDAARRFCMAGADRVIFSKLDETTAHGALLNVADSVGLPISYLATGQRVPEDLETASGRRIAELVVS